MGINNVLASHTQGMGAGQDYDDFTNSQSGSGTIPTPQQMQQTGAQQPTNGGGPQSLLASFSDRQLRQLTFLGVLAADVLLLLIYLGV